jgi:translocation and assembly module TamB
MDAKAIRTALIQTYLPKQVIVKSLINANVGIQRQKSALTGRYRLDTTPIQVLISTKENQQEIRLGKSAISGTINGDKVAANIDLSLAGHDFLTGKLLLDTGKTQSISGTISVAIAQLSIIQAFVPQLSGIKGFLKADLALQGPIKKPLVSGQIDLSEGTLDIGQAGTEQLGLRHIEFHALASGNRSNHIQLQGSAIPTLVNKANVPEKRSITTKINLDADLDVQDTIAGGFRLTLPANTSIALVTQGTRKEIRLGATMLSGHIIGELLSADLDMALLGQDYLRGNLHINTGKSQTLSAQAMASIHEFAFIEPLVPQLSDVKGQLNANFTASGTTQNPLINGDIHLGKGTFSVEKFGLTIKDIDFQAVASSKKADVIQLKGLAKSGEGSITLDGTLGLQPDAHFPIEMTLNGKDFEVAKLPEAQVTVSPDLKVVLNDQQKQVGGELTVPKAILKIQDIPEHAVRVSADEIILGEEKAESDTQKAPDINADIEVKLGKQVNFTGQGLQTNLAGYLKIIKAGEKMAMQGHVDMEKASYKRFGQDLTVRKGRFVFNGPADNPWLDVEAIRLSKSKKVTAILALTGTLKNPQTRISSEPSLPESEALAYLVTGNPLNQVSKAESNMLASAALSYGAGKATWLADKLGIDEFKVEEGSSLRDSLLVMGEYLTPDFYVGTKVGMFNKQANIVLKHKITDTINVESQAGTSQRIKLNYEFDGD